MCVLGIYYTVHIMQWYICHVCIYVGVQAFMLLAMHIYNSMFSLSEYFAGEHCVNAVKILHFAGHIHTG